MTKREFETVMKLFDVASGLMLLAEMSSDKRTATKLYELAEQICNDADRLVVKATG